MCEHTHHQAGRPRPTKHSIAPASHGAGYALFIATIAIMAILFCPQSVTAQGNCDVGECCPDCLNKAVLAVTFVDQDPSPPYNYIFSVSGAVEGVSFYTTTVGGVFSIVEGGTLITSPPPHCAGESADPELVGCSSCGFGQLIEVDVDFWPVIFKLRSVTNKHDWSLACDAYHYVAVGLSNEVIDLPDNPDFGGMTCEKPVNDPVNAVNGNLYLERTDAVIRNDIGMPIVLSRHYNGLEPDSTLRWSHSYQYKLIESWRYDWSTTPRTILIGDVALVQGDGKTIRFQCGGDRDQPTFSAIGSGYRLEYGVGGDDYTVTTDDETKLTFEMHGSPSEGRLTRIEDRNGNAQDLAWSDETLDTIDAGDGKLIELLYTEVDDLPVIQEIRDGLDNVIATYFYADNDTRAVLDSVHYADGSWEKYGLRKDPAEPDYRITSSLNSDGATWNWAYSGSMVIEAYNNESPDVEFAGLTYDTTDVLEGQDVIGYTYETTVRNNHDASQETVYTSYRPTYQTRRDLISVEDAACPSCATSYTHNSAGQKTTVTYGNGRLDSLYYSPSRGLLASLVQDAGDAPNRLVTTYEYDDEYNLLFKITRPSVAKPGDVTELEFVRDATTGNVDQMIARGWTPGTPNPTQYTHTTDFSYDEEDRLKEIDGPRPDIDVRDTVGFWYHDGVDSTRDMKWAKYPYDNTIEFGMRDGTLGDYPYKEDANGVRTTYTYDARGRIDVISENALVPTGGRKITDVDFNFAGEIDFLTMPLGNTYDFKYEQYGWLTEIENSSGEDIRFVRDAMSNQWKAKYYDNLGVDHRLEEATYNWKSQLVAQNGHEYRYDHAGQMDTIVLPPLEGATDNDTVAFTYDPYGRIESVTEVVANSSIADRVITSYEYDAHGNLKTVTDPGDYVYSFEYDDRGLLVEETSDVRGAITYQYDEAGNLIYRKDAEAVEVNYEYDAMNRLIKIDYPTDLDVVYDYDSTYAYGMGRLARQVKTDGTSDYDVIHYIWDAFGRLEREVHKIGTTSYTTAYVYNKNDGLQDVTYPSGVRYSYAYDSEGRVDSITAQYDGGQREFVADVMGYMPFGPITSIRYDNGIITDYTYDNKYRVTGISTGLNAILDRTYEYDAAWNVKSIDDLLDSDNTMTLTYDRQNRLTRRDLGDPIDLSKKYSFGYLKNGNRDSRSWSGHLPVSEDYSYDAENRLGNIALRIGTSTSYTYFTHYDNGNIDTETEGSITIDYDYDEESRLSLVTRTGDANVSYGFNTRSQRQTSTLSGNTDTYVHSDNGLLLSEFFAPNDSWGHDYVYLYGRPIVRVWADNDTIYPDSILENPDRPGGMTMRAPGPGFQLPRIETNYSFRWYHTDHLGTPLAMTWPNDSIAWEADYLPFGRIVGETNGLPNNNNLRFPGQYHDRYAGLYYNQHRFYQPDLGRYITPDPIGIRGGLNLYSYAGQNPINKFDFYGLDNNSSPWSVGWEWLTGTGPQTRYFEKGDPFTEMLRRHGHIQSVRELVLNRLRNCDGEFGNRSDYDLGGLSGIPKYIGDYSTLLTGGLAGNLAVTYLGSYDLEYKVTDVNWAAGSALIRFHVVNYSTIASATHPPWIGYTDSWNRYIGQPLNDFFSSGPMSEKRQVFNWSDQLRFNPCECR